MHNIHKCESKNFRQFQGVIFLLVTYSVSQPTSIFQATVHIELNNPDPTKKGSAEAEFGNSHRFAMFAYRKS